jgi:hypothetical protein
MKTWGDQRIRLMPFPFLEGEAPRALPMEGATRAPVIAAVMSVADKGR